MAGKFSSEAAWCQGVLASADTRVPMDWKLFALRHLAQIREVADSLQWARRLQAMEEAGTPLLYCQQRAWRAALKRWTDNGSGASG